MNTMRAAGQRDIGARVDQNRLLCAQLRRTVATRSAELARGKLLGADLDHLHAIAGGARATSSESVMQ